MLQSPEQKFAPAAPPTNYTPVKATSPMDQANIGRSLVIKGEITGAESLFIDGRVEGTINFPENRVTIGRNGNVAANIVAKEVVIMGKVQGNVDCTDRLDIRNEGMLAGDVITHRISVEEGAILKGGVEVRHPEKKDQNQHQNKSAEAAKSAVASATGQAPNAQAANGQAPKSMAATAGQA
jgi:cytoskeletal protein CcmA (bactofilin family)